MHNRFLSKINFHIYIFLSFLLFNPLNFAQVAPTVYKVLGITVEGNKSADARTIIANCGIKSGDEIQVPGDQTVMAIKHLWALNIFSDVQIIIDKKVEGGVFLLIKVEEYPRLEKVVFEGNDEISKSDIEAKINFVRGQILKVQEVAKLKQKILKLYEDEGYFNAQITPKYFIYYNADTVNDKINVIWHNRSDLAEEYTVEYDKPLTGSSSLIDKIKDRILLKLDIVENERATVREIHFNGNQAFSEDDLKSEFKETEESVWWKFWSSARLNKTKYEDDKKLIEKFYKKNGYRDAEVISDSLVYYNDKQDVNIYVNVYEGIQYKIRNITWEGNTIYKSDFLTDRLGFNKGDVYDLDKFDQNLKGNEKQTDIASLYLDNGYLMFNVKTTETKVGDDSMDVLIQISEKSQFKVGKVEISGNDKTIDKVIRRELYTLPGDYFNRALLFRSLQQLANLQYFNVEKLYQEGVDYQLANDSTVDVTYKVEEKSSDYLNASIGYSGSFGFSGSMGVTLSNFSLSEPFSLGGGQVLNFNWQFGIGNYYRTLSVGFTEPWMFDTPTLVGFDLFNTRQQYVYDLAQTGASVRVGRKLKWPDDYFYIQGTFRYQYNDVIDGAGYYNTGISHQYTLGLEITRKNIDNPVFPSTGSNYDFGAEISGGPFLPGDVDYYKISFKSEWYKKLFGYSRLVFYTCSNLGYIQELTAGTQIQPFEFFYMGGNGMVIATEPLRGYDDRSIGPVDYAGQIYGGRVFTRYTTELRFAVTLEPMPVYLLTFAEAGNVYENLKTMDAFDLRRSAGVGARILINPIGLIGFDLGYGFDRKLVNGKDPAWLFHFQFGKGF
jgi:outer membrane protein insertion porin family